MNINPDYTVSVTDLARKTSRVLNDVADNNETYTILKDNKFAAVVVPFDRYRATQQRLQTLESRSRTFVNETFHIPEGKEITFQRANGFPLGVDPISGPGEHIGGTWERYEETQNLSVAVGASEDLRIVRINLAGYAQGGIGPHGSVGGDHPTIGMENLILSLALRHSPTDVAFAVLDASGADTPLYGRNLRGLPHFADTSNDVADPEFHDVISAEIDARMELMSRHRVADLSGYRALRRGGDYHLPPVPTLFVVVVGPEDGGLPEDLTHMLSRVAALGRSVGIHLLLDDSLVSTQLEQHLTYRFVSDHGGHRTTLTTSDANQEPVVLAFPTMNPDSEAEITKLVDDIRGIGWDVAPLTSRRSH